MFANIYSTPVGNLLMAEKDGCLVKVGFNQSLPIGAEDFQTPLIKKAFAELCEYLSGQRREFDLPLAPQGTPFQQKVWRTLQTIPYG